MVVTSEPQGRKLDDPISLAHDKCVLKLKSGDPHSDTDAEMKDQVRLSGTSWDIPSGKHTESY